MTKPKSNDLLASLKMQIGDYCHAHRWCDSDPHDPFAVGFLYAVMISKTQILFKLQGDGVPDRWFRHCEKITQEQGKKLLEKGQ